MDINSYWERLDDIEKKRIEDMEVFDEDEEWKIKCAHYFVLYAEKGATNLIKESNDLSPNSNPVVYPITETQSNLLYNLITLK